MLQADHRAIVDTSIVNVALSNMAGNAWGLDSDEIGWVATGYSSRK